MSKRFSANDFTATEHSSANDKAKFANQFVRLVETDFKPTLFPKWFYNRLSMCFGHIAHFNQGGFYDAQLSTPGRRAMFLRQALNWPCYGQPQFTYCDVERALQTWLREAGHYGRLVAQVTRENEAAERAELARLQEKYADR